ncbi:hypothetical protein [Flavisolibacter ginsenosidimutans]|uniref:Energy transducer TonB n=1 Tax=Flavisolibacter ginsenosidimutans TaxID=661481 RepID=A0A5B8UFL6_9BACT|nr:hypothetical protein [Flavisolibacter ginsenosidimutans]QEC55096.1 hypothetical protein FSB75_03975 [Flavisolibacter ginsenosidimutans]
MNNYAAMTVDLDKRNYAQAALYTGLIALALLLVIWFVKFYQPIVPPQPVEEAIEVNLGSSDVGSGKDQPELPGEPAPEQKVAYTPPQTSNATEEAAKDFEDNNEKDAAPVTRPSVTKSDARKLNEETKVVKTNAAPSTAPPAPPVPHPKAVMGQVRGGNGNGGNGAATYKPGTGEGQGGGPGDQGSVGGNPNGKDYTPRHLGVRVVSIPAQSFQDDFNEGGTIVLDIEVNPSGQLTSANYQVSGSSLPRSSKQYNIALTRARQIKYPQYDGGFKQRLSFNFSVK